MAFPTAAKRGLVIKIGAASNNLAALPPLDTFKVELFDVKDTALRSATGTLIDGSQRTGAARLHMKWRSLPCATISQILTLCVGSGVYIGYSDPKTQAQRTALFRATSVQTDCAQSYGALSLTAEEV